MFKKVALVLAVAGVSMPVLAAKGDFGLGIEGGAVGAETKDIAAEFGQSLAVAMGTTVKGTYERAELAFRMYGFYSITDQIDAEIGYFRTGSFDFDYSVSGTSTTASGELEVDGFDYGVRFRPSDNWFLKAGMHRLDLTETVTGTIFGTTFRMSGAVDATGAYFGGGYNFNESWNIGYTFYNDVGGDEGMDVNFLYAGYRFF